MQDEFSALGRLRKGLASEGGQKAYLDWMRSPMTEQLLLAAAELASPRALENQEVSAEYLLGHTVGQHEILRFLRTLSTAGNPTSDGRSIIPKPTYNGQQ